MNLAVHLAEGVCEVLVAEDDGVRAPVLQIENTSYIREVSVRPKAAYIALRPTSCFMQRTTYIALRGTALYTSHRVP